MHYNRTTKYNSACTYKDFFEIIFCSYADVIAQRSVLAVCVARIRERPI